MSVPQSADSGRDVAGHWEWRYADNSQGDAPPSRYAVEAVWVDDPPHNNNSDGAKR